MCYYDSWAKTLELFTANSLKISSNGNEIPQGSWQSPSKFFQGLSLGDFFILTKMQYTISINQKAIIDGWFKIDLIDAAIIDYCRNYFLSPEIVKYIEGNDVFFWIEYSHLLQEMPLLGITSKDVLGRRLRNLCVQKIFCQRVTKTSGSKTYFKFWEKYRQLVFDSVPHDSKAECSPDHPTQKSEAPDSKVVCHPTQKSSHIKEISIPVISIPDHSMDLSAQKTPIKGSFEEAEIYFQKLRDEIERESALDPEERTIGNEMMKFYLYWTAPMKSGKLLWRSKPTFSFGLRLANWMWDKKDKSTFNFSKPTWVWRI